jgi:hypothetical protein
LLLGGGALAAFIFGATPTPQPTSTEPPTVAPTSAPPTLAVGQLPLTDAFSNAQSGFGITSDADGSVAYAGDGLRFSLVTRGFEYRSTSHRVAAQDVIVETDVQQVSGPDRNEMGLACRYQENAKKDPNDDTFIGFALSGEGQVTIWQSLNGQVNRLVDWNTALLVDNTPGLVHRLKAACVGDKLSLDVDGHRVADATDPAPLTGDIALLAAMRADGQLEVQFDNLLVSAP